MSLFHGSSFSYVDFFLWQPHSGAGPSWTKLLPCLLSDSRWDKMRWEREREGSSNNSHKSSVIDMYCTCPSLHRFCDQGDGVWDDRSAGGIGLSTAGDRGQPWASHMARDGETLFPTRNSRSSYLKNGRLMLREHKEWVSIVRSALTGPDQLNFSITWTCWERVWLWS